MLELVSIIWIMNDEQMCYELKVICRAMPVCMSRQCLKTYRLLLVGLMKKCTYIFFFPIVDGSAARIEKNRSSGLVAQYLWPCDNIAITLISRGTFRKRMWTMSRTIKSRRRTTTATTRTYSRRCARTRRRTARWLHLAGERAPAHVHMCWTEKLNTLVWWWSSWFFNIPRARHCHSLGPVANRTSRAVY